MKKELRMFDIENHVLESSLPPSEAMAEYVEKEIRRNDIAWAICLLSTVIIAICIVMPGTTQLPPKVDKAYYEKIDSIRADSCSVVLQNYKDSVDYEYFKRQSVKLKRRQ